MNLRQRLDWLLRGRMISDQREERRIEPEAQRSAPSLCKKERKPQPSGSSRARGSFVSKDFRYEGFSEPNYTPVPDDLFDLIAPNLTESELRVLLYIIRRTFGFK